MVGKRSDDRLKERPRQRGRMATLARGGRVRRRMIALVLATGLLVPGALVALTPSTAGADGTDPLGPTLAQVEAFYATAVANGQVTLASVEDVYGLVSREVGILGDQPGCTLYLVESLLGPLNFPPNYDCFI
jgi:hypothetical protein